MTKHGIILLFILGVIFATGCVEKTEIEQPPADMVQEQEWVDSFNIEECDFSSTGENEYFILKPGYQLTLEGPDEDNNSVELILTVLNVTRTIDGVETRVLEEKESVNGVLEEISWNFFAFCRGTQDIYYFGEEVDIYYEGYVVGHEGAWKAGSNDARAGIMMHGTNREGYRYYQEVAPDIAMDRAEIITDNETLETPAGTFTNVLKIRETTPLEPDALEYKFHAPGIGLVKDEELLLTRYGYIDLNTFPAYITRQYAEEIASAAANGTIIEVLAEERADGMVYIVQMVEGTIRTNVTIDALTGAIITTEESAYEGKAVDTTGKITEDQAREIALNALPGTVTDVAIERKGGKLVYVVEIKYNYLEKDVLVDMVTGEIIRIES